MAIHIFNSVRYFFTPILYGPFYPYPHFGKGKNTGLNRSVPKSLIKFPRTGIPDFLQSAEILKIC